MSDPSEPTGGAPVPARDQITDHAQLRAVYRPPSQRVIDKVIDHIDEGVADFVASSPLVVLATASANRADASPRGGPPGFVRVLDRQRLAWGDLTGNNRLDTFTNALEQPAIGLLFLVPGVLEMLRVTGTAELVQDPSVLEACAIDGRTANTAVVVTVRECYIHCGAALRRASLWEPSTWPSTDARPSGAEILGGHLDARDSTEEIAAGLAHYYESSVWEPGGTHD